MKCTECGGKKFKEYGRGGILRVGCEACEGTGETSNVLSLEVLDKALATYPEVKHEMVYVEALNDNSSGIGQPVAKPAKPRKRKKKTKVV